MEIRLTTHGFEITAELEKYLVAKQAIIRRNVPRAQRSHASCQFHFTQTLLAGVKSNTCSITIRLSDVELKAKETTRHMYAAVDIATVHMEQQLKGYASTHRKRFLRGRP